jgi:ATP-binding cassette subfamily C protein LapB
VASVSASSAAWAPASRRSDACSSGSTSPIAVDSADARAFDPHELRRAVGFVAQETELFAGTLRDNLVMGRPAATEGEIARAARIAGIDRLAQSHPLGFAMPVGERGQALSGGQRQAVAIARALLRAPKILFLDEPSSAMDVNTEGELIKGLREWMSSGQTLIVSTHRLALVELCTRLVVMDGGRIVADGPRDQVLATLSGRPKVALTVSNGERVAP